MANYYTNTNVLEIPGYEVYFTRFADSIVNDHFVAAKEEIAEILTNFYINERQIIAGGGGLSTITQALGLLLVHKGWTKVKIESEHHVAGRVLTVESHEVDHYKAFPEGRIGLEIEWNNKDPFYDRDLENFRKLHQIGEMSLGIIVTRGASLQIELFHVYKRFLSSLQNLDYATILANLPDISDKAKTAIRKLCLLPPEESLHRIASVLYFSKYGSATTHMDKLLLRIQRGVGNPCPLILIGIGASRLIRS